MRTAREQTEAAVVLAKLSMRNAMYHADGVRNRFGGASLEYLYSKKVVDEAKRELVKAFDAAIALDRRAALTGRD